MEIKIIFAMIILSVCKVSLSKDKHPTTCTATGTVDINFEDIKNIFSIKEDLMQFINDMVSVQIPILRDSLLEPSVHDEDQDLNVTQMITKYGFRSEVHEVTTKDGYILTMHRIPGDGPAVCMMHGLMCSSDEWIIQGRNKSLAFELASAGYDVWMCNARGNKYSRKHTALSPECDEFWEFGLDEISLIDAPTMVDYAFNHTSKSSHRYYLIGFGQGATNVLSLLSEMPQYNEKVSLAVLLAPAVYCSHWESPLYKLISMNPEGLHKFSKFIEINNLGPGNELQSNLTDFFCGNHPLSKIVCSNYIGIAYGYSRGELDITRLPVLSRHAISGASVRQFIHFGQMGRTGKFQKFDFTDEKNLEVYGSKEPPTYNLKNVTAPVAIYRAEYDLTVHPTDLNQLVDELPNVVNVTQLKNFGHLDHYLGKHSREFQNEPIVQLLHKYRK